MSEKSGVRSDIEKALDELLPLAAGAVGGAVLGRQAGKVLGKMSKKTNALYRKADVGWDDLQRQRKPKVDAWRKDPSSPYPGYTGEESAMDARALRDYQSAGMRQNIVKIAGTYGGANAGLVGGNEYNRRRKKR